MDPRRSRINPPRRELSQPGLRLLGGFECRPPCPRVRRGKHIFPVPFRNVLADGVTGEPIDPALPLLEVNRVRRKVPVDDGVAPPVEVDPFLPDAGRSEHEGGKGAVEGMPDFTLPNRLSCIGLIRSPVLQSETRAQLDLCPIEGCLVRSIGCSPNPDRPPATCSARKRSDSSSMSRPPSSLWSWNTYSSRTARRLPSSQ